jgi:hypothetical protein
MKPIQTVVVVFLSLLALVQLLRVLLGWSVVVNGIAIPIWASTIAVLVAGGLALLLWREARR